ncbi:MAG: proline/glycine betaine ABC transporter permease ProW, partial [Leptolyngbya sp. SIO1D8]|nr:proline/glycine betaine ABC transporter permease ProW [Leptolyngbya sp. SIO1D8]
AVPGLGLLVLRGLGNLDVGMSAVGGISILGMAILLDRITQAAGQSPLNARQHRGPIGLVRQWFAPAKRNGLTKVT